MSLKDVIMTLNDFYAVKLEKIFSYLHLVLQQTHVTEDETKEIEKIVKDNEVWIPYDEDIFIGIDKNYKTLKKILNEIKEVQIKSSGISKEADSLRLSSEELLDKKKVSEWKIAE